MYLHVLFVEPHPSIAVSRVSAGRQPCCNHTTAVGPTQTVWNRSAGSAWQVLVEVAESLPDRVPCRQQPDDCCASCVVATSAATIVRRWMAVELDAYGQPDTGPEAQHRWANLAAARMARTFRRQHRASCRTPTADIGVDIVEAPSPEVLPLTAELISLWTDPGRTEAAPVVSWLNHCAGLGDVARIIESRRTAA